jgi:hypothetical protein
MLVLLAAATLAAAPAPALPSPLIDRSVRTGRYDLVVRRPSACKAAGRLQAADPEAPAALFRPRDRIGGPDVHRLIDLPRAEICLLGGADRGADR